MATAAENGSELLTRRTFTITDAVWDEFKAITRTKGLTPGVALRVIVTQYVESHRGLATQAVRTEMEDFLKLKGLSPEQAMLMLQALQLGHDGTDVPMLPRGHPAQTL